MTPLGISDGVLYAALVVLSLWFPDKKAIIIAAALGTLLTILGFFFSPQGGILWMAIFNRIVAIFAVLIIAALSFKYKETVTEIIQSRKEMEALMQTAKDTTEELQAIYDNNIDGILVADPETKKFYRCNPAMCQMLGYTENELLTLSVDDIHHPQRMPCVLNVFNRMKTGSVDFVSEIPFLRKDGTVFYADIGSKRVMLKNKPYLIGFFKDVTDRIEAQEKIKILAKFPDENPYPVLRVSKELRVLYANRSSKLFFKHLNGDSLKTNHAALPQHWAEPINKALNSAKSIDFEFKIGDRIYNCTIVPLISLDSVYVYGRDITESKKAQEQLRISENRLSMAIEASRAGIYDYSVPVGDVCYYSEQLANILGFKRKELPDCSELIEWINSRIHPEDIDRFYGAYSDFIIGCESAFNIEMRMRHKNGHWLYVQQSSKAVERNDSGKVTHLIGVMIDITNRKHQEEEVKREKEKVEQLNATLEERVKEELAQSRNKDSIMIQQSRQAAIGEMIGHIAHQWRQPINALQILINNIGDSFEDNTLDKPLLEDLIETGNRIINKMSTTIDDFRNFFKPNREKQDFSVNNAIKEALALIDASIKFHNITIEIKETEEITIHGYPNEYSHVVLNIINNAKAAILEKQVIGKIEITISTIYGSKGSVTIQDNGGGIAESIIDRIFDPYFTTKPQGTGIGLYMSKVIIENNMDGSLKVRNTADGAEFQIITAIVKEREKIEDKG
ncbi:PAS/PAC sensor signal transduction histidine kinase [Candidatus Magnetoovum chiemensis]|nr:PAS/PAC sensor signal transduction histidine kinase [Candidatus Magnetoovum chiemensis]